MTYALSAGRRRRVHQVLSFAIQLAFLWTTTTVVRAGQNPCHVKAQKKSTSCTVVTIPVGLCPVCGVGAPMQESNGSYIDCTRTSGLEDAVTGEQCRALVQDYIELNPCDSARLTALEFYNSTNPTTKEKGRQRLDYFLYSVCENGCDCIPQVDANPAVKQIDVHRGNCQAHAYYDVCKILPSIRLIRREDDDNNNSTNVTNLPAVCPLITDWFINSGDGQDFLEKPHTTVDVDVEYFLDRLVHAEELLATNNSLWDQCLHLETLQGRINTTEPFDAPSAVPCSPSSEIPSETPSDTPLSFPTSDPPSDAPSEAPSGGPSDIPSEEPSSWPSDMPSDSPSYLPSELPSDSPSHAPSDLPSVLPSESPTSLPSEALIPTPSALPSNPPSDAPSDLPSQALSDAPSDRPSQLLSDSPSDLPSQDPSDLPSHIPSELGLSPSPTISSEPAVLPTESVLPSAAPSGKAFEPIRISAGELDAEYTYTDVDGHLWSSDAHFNGTGDVYHWVRTIKGTADDELYTTQRFGADMRYSISVPAGEYQLSLHFCELTSKFSGRRVFDVFVEGEPVLSSFDIFDAVGKGTAYGVELTVTVTDGALDVTFGEVVGNPTIAGIELAQLIQFAPTVAPSNSASPSRSLDPTGSIQPTNGGINTPSASPKSEPTLLPSASLLPSGTPTVFEPVRISAGELDSQFSYTDVDSNLWSPDDNFGSTGDVYQWIRTIKNTNDDVLYTTQRFGADMYYSIPVPPGEYQLLLHFCELTSKFSGRRVFDVFVEDAMILNDFDIFDSVGKGSALVVERTVTILDGALDVTFGASIGNPTLAGIEVVQLVQFDPTEAPTSSASPTRSLQPSAQPSESSSMSLGPSVSHQPSEMPTRSMRPSGAPTSLVFDPLHISSGEMDNEYSYTDTEGNSWAHDVHFGGTGDVFHLVRTIKGTANDELYTTQRFGADMHYSIPVQSGEYKILLHFCELTSKYSGRRVFDVSVEGATVLRDLDIFDNVGKGRALVVERTVAVTDGALDVSFAQVVGNPTIAGIELYQMVQFSPTANPTDSLQPSLGPSDFPSSEPSSEPTDKPFLVLSQRPSDVPSNQPSFHPSDAPSNQPSFHPSDAPSNQPSFHPSDAPSNQPSFHPSDAPSSQPSFHPSDAPSNQPSFHPSDTPSNQPSLEPSAFPSNEPSLEPSDLPSNGPSLEPSDMPSMAPLFLPSDMPSDAPSDSPSESPSSHPSDGPSDCPSVMPSSSPTLVAVDKILINAGELSETFTDVTSAVWEADKFYNADGTFADSTRRPIRRTVDDPLYKTWREGRYIKYVIPIAPGDYEITLHFSENSYAIAGARFFDVLIESHVVFYSLDVLKLSGKERRAYSFETVMEVLDGELTIELVAIAGNAFICGIEIKRNGPHLAHSVPGGPYVLVDVNDVGSVLVPVDGSLSHTHALDLSIVVWSWIFGGVEIASGRTALLNLPVGEHVVNLKVIDDGGNEADQITEVIVLPSGYPVVELLLPDTGDVTGGETVAIAGDGFNYTADEIVVRFGSTSLTGSQIVVVNSTFIKVDSTPAVAVGLPVEVQVVTPKGESNIEFYTYVADMPIEFETGVVANPFGPTTLAFGPDRKLYVGTQTGMVAKFTLGENYTVVESVISTVVAASELPSFRTILGIAFDPMDTSPNPTAFVTHSTLFHGSNASYTGVSINGKVSALSGPNLDSMQHVVTNLPVSDRDHAVNGLVFGDNGDLYIQVGGNTNAGVPGKLSGSRSQEDNVLSSATLVAHLGSENFNGTLEYGSDGSLMAGSGVEVFATGERNSFDIVLHSNGNLYATDNGPNKGFGGESTSCTSADDDPSEPDELNLVVRDAFYGQANRPRGQCVWRSANQKSDMTYTAPLKQLPSSTNGIVEFETAHFGGQLLRNLIVGQYQGNLYRIVLNESGGVAFGPSVLSEEGGLDVTQGPDGTLFVAQIESSTILYHRPVELPSVSLLVKAIYPRRGPSEGGTVLSVYGENFGGQPSVLVGSKPCPVVSSFPSMLECVLPPGSGAVDVAVSVGPDASILQDSYRYIGFSPILSDQPSEQPSERPSISPTFWPSGAPSSEPSISDAPTESLSPSTESVLPTFTDSYAILNSAMPSVSLEPSDQPSDKPSGQPSGRPSDFPTNQPSEDTSLSVSPSSSSSESSAFPSTSLEPSASIAPSGSFFPSADSVLPTFIDSLVFSSQPSVSPSGLPSDLPSLQPDVPSDLPSAKPSQEPSISSNPSSSGAPSLSNAPSESVHPFVESELSSQPSDHPSDRPSDQPSDRPSDRPSDLPSDPPSDLPSDEPSAVPSFETSGPYSAPSVAPTSHPSEWTLVSTSGNLKKRHEACFVMSNGKGYLIGGRGLKPVTEFDPVSKTWTRKSFTPIELHHMQCVTVEDSIFIVSSWTGNYPNETNVADIHIYNTTDDSWSTRSGLPEERRRGGAAAVLVGRNGTREIYVSHGNRGGHGEAAVALGWLDKYDVDRDQWTTNLPDASHPRDHTGGGLVQNDTLLCVAGGRDTGVVDFFDAVVLPTECYNLNTGSWEVKPNIPAGRAGSAYGTTCDGKLMVAGGEGFGQAYDNVDVFDGTSWETIDSLERARHGTGLAFSCVCNEIYIASGSGNQGGTPELTTTERYRPVTSTCN